jgi:hypothetical protein
MGDTRTGPFFVPGERAGDTVNGRFIKSPFPRTKKIRHGYRRRTEPRADVGTTIPESQKTWLEQRARAMKISTRALLRMLVEFYHHACTAREKELAQELRAMFPPGTKGVDKPFAMASDAFRENLG